MFFHDIEFGTINGDYSFRREDQSQSGYKITHLATEMSKVLFCCNKITLFEESGVVIEEINEEYEKELLEK